MISMVELSDNCAVWFHKICEVLKNIQSPVASEVMPVMSRTTVAGGFR
jgi:hypothetical protein